MSAKLGIGEAHGSFGEIIQGNRFYTSKSFLVTLPINLFSKSQFVQSHDNTGLHVIPPNKTKSLKALEMLKKELDLCDGTLILKSEIPEGKGLSSSSADMVSALKAYASVNNISISNDKIGKIISAIEPSDAVMYDSCVAFYNRSGECFMNFNYIPSLVIFGIDDGGTIDTYDCYTKRAKQGLGIHYEQEKLLKNLIKAFNDKDIYKIGNVSTQSAIINQQILPKKYFPLLMEIRNKYHLPGVIISHTGTYQGLMIINDKQYIPTINNITKELKSRNLKFKRIYTLSKISNNM